MIPDYSLHSMLQARQKQNCISRAKLPEQSPERKHGGGRVCEGGVPPRAKHGRASLVTVREATESSLLGAG